MKKILLLLFFSILGAKWGIALGNELKDDPAKSLITKEELEIIKVMDILELMDLMDNLDLIKEMDVLTEDETYESDE